MSKIICGECGTENEQEYQYCKNCGAKLSMRPVDASQTRNTQAHEFIGSEQETDNPGYDSSNYANYSKSTYTQGSYNSGNQYNAGQNFSSPNPNAYGDITIDGIPADEVAVFVGKKAYNIMPKFTKMEITNSKVSWCWPAAVLGILLGPLGSAIWFFYRKMYKIALILLAIGTVLTATVTVMTYDKDSTYYNNAMEAFESGDLDQIFDTFDNMPKTQTELNVAANAIERLACIATCVLMGIFGYYFYKEHTVKAIRNFRNSSNNQQYYRMALSSIGGVSGGMLALGIIANIAVDNIASLISLIMSSL